MRVSTRIAPRDWAEFVLQLAEPSQQDWVALEFKGEKITIKELAEAMGKAAATLADGERRPVAVSDGNPIRHTIAVLGAVAAGRTAMLVDSKVPAAMLAELAEKAAVETAIGRPIPDTEFVEFSALSSGEPIDPIESDPETTGSIFLTSGSTGVPKMVMRSRAADLHAAMCLRLANFPIDPGDRHWMCVPHASASFLTLLMGGIFARATVVLEPFEAAKVDRFLVEKQISSAYMVPTMLRLARERMGLEGEGWRGLRALMIGGEKLDAPTAEALFDLFAGRMYLSYGMTEIPRPAEATFEQMVARPGTVGRPIPLRRIRIVEPGTDVDVPIGEEGEVLATGPDLYQGYVGGGPAPPWHPTTDLGRLDEQGFLYITGRAASVVQVGANRVSTDEVAAELRRHPVIAQAAVIAIEDPVWTTQLRGFVITHTGEEIPEEELKNWLRERQPAYKVPRAFHHLSELPRDPSGKLSMQTLKQLATDLS